MYRKLITPALKDWITIVNNQYEDAAAMLCLGVGLPDLTPDMAKVYWKFTSENSYYKKALSDMDEAMQQGVELFFAGWPLLEYVKNVHYICMNIIDHIALSEVQDQAINKALFLINNNIIKQETILQIFNDQQHITEYMQMSWNKTQENIFNSTIDFLQIISEIYLQKQSPKIRKILMSPVSAYKWFSFLLSDDSNLKENTPDNKKKKQIMASFYTWGQYISVLLGITSILFICLGKKNNREIYIVLLLVSFLVWFGIYFHRRKHIDRSIDQVKAASDWLANATADEIYRPNLQLADLQSTFLESPRL